MASYLIRYNQRKKDNTSEQWLDNYNKTFTV